MKALTIKQPYASAIMQGHKLYETRSWHPGKVEKFVLHAGLGAALSAQTWMHDLMPIPGWPLLSELPSGAGLGIVKIIDVHKVADLVDEIDEFEFHIGEWSNGYAWELEVVKEFDPPIPAKGQLRFWNWPTTEIKVPVNKLFPTK